MPMSAIESFKYLAGLRKKDLIYTKQFFTAYYQHEECFNATELQIMRSYYADQK